MIREVCFKPSNTNEEYTNTLSNIDDKKETYYEGFENIDNIKEKYAIGQSKTNKFSDTYDTKDKYYSGYSKTNDDAQENYLKVTDANDRCNILLSTAYNAEETYRGPFKTLDMNEKYYNALSKFNEAKRKYCMDSSSNNTQEKTGPFSSNNNAAQETDCSRSLQSKFWKSNNPNERYYKIKVPEHVDSQAFIQSVLSSIARKKKIRPEIICHEIKGCCDILDKKHVIFEESEDTYNNENIREDYDKKCDAIHETKIGNGDPCSETSSDDVMLPIALKKSEDITKNIKKKHKEDKIKRKVIQKECKRQAKEIIREFKLKEKKRREKEKKRLKQIEKYEKERDRKEKKCRQERARCEKKKEKVTKVKEKEMLRQLKAKMEKKCIEVSFGDAEVPFGNPSTDSDVIKAMMKGLN